MSAAAASISSAIPTRMPCARSAPAKPASAAATLKARSIRAGGSNKLGDRRLAGDADVLLVLEQAPERDAGKLRLEPGPEREHALLFRTLATL